MVRVGGRDFHPGTRDSSEVGIAVGEIRVQVGRLEVTDGGWVFMRWIAYSLGKVTIFFSCHIIVDLVAF